MLLISIYHRITEINALEADDVIIRSVINKGKTLLRLNNKNNQEFSLILLTNLTLILSRNLLKTKTQKNLLSTRIHFYTYLQIHLNQHVNKNL